MSNQLREALPDIAKTKLGSRLDFFDCCWVLNGGGDHRQEKSHPQLSASLCIKDLEVVERNWLMLDYRYSYA